MRSRTKFVLSAAGALSCVLAGFAGRPSQNAQKHQNQKPAAARTIPKIWDDVAMASLEVPLADPKGSPKQVLSTYYYKIPVRPIFKSYPVYAPGHEPPGYMNWLKQQEPVIVWDDKGHAPRLNTDGDWVRAGEIVFDSPAVQGGLFGGAPTDVLYVREPQFYDKTNPPIAADGTVPFYRYVVQERERSQSESWLAQCATRASCRTAPF